MEYRVSFAHLVACGGTVAVEPTVPPATPESSTTPSTATPTLEPTVTLSPTITPSPTVTPIPTLTSLPEQADLIGDWIFTGDPGCDGSINFVQQVRFAEGGTIDWFDNKDSGRWKEDGDTLSVIDTPSGDRC